MPIPCIPQVPSCVLCSCFHITSTKFHILALAPYHSSYTSQGYNFTFLRILCSCLLWQKLHILGYKPSNYSGHSFCYSGASFTFSLRVPHELIQQQGDWNSNAYLQYLSKPLTQHLRVATAFRSALQHKLRSHLTAFSLWTFTCYLELLLTNTLSFFLRLLYTLLF